MRLPPWVLAVVGLAVVVAAANVALFSATRDDKTPAAAAATSRGDAVVVVDPASGRAVGRIPVGHLPTAIVARYGAVWVLNRADGTLSRIDPRAQRVAATMTPDALPSDVAAGAGGFWFAGPPRGRSRRLEVADVERLDPSTGAVDRSFVTNTGASAIAAGGGAVWSTGYLGGHVRGAARSDTRTGRMRKLDIGIYGDLVAADDTAAYWVSSISSRVARVSARTGKLTRTMTLATDESLAKGLVPPNPTDVALGGGSLWISTTDGTLLRIDPKLAGISAAIHVCHNALSVAYGLGAAWVACGDGTVVRVDPASGRPASPIVLHGLPSAVAVGAGQVWVTVT